jgi:hypothetical protein
MSGDWSWVKRIRKGDVLRAGSGVLRIVRAVQHTGLSIPKTSVTFAIRHCSWTHACYTVYTGNDLRQMGYSPVRASFKLTGKLDRMIEQDFGKPGYERKLTCCDVIGVA